jgi:4-diphosphocytidyl-2-C-methyl-D-erythritol kinase
VRSVARVSAQAKLNLLLRVLAKETSGYHSIETVFARIDLADEVTVRISSAGARSLDCTGPTMPANGLGPTERNLAFRAAAAYADATGWPNGFAIEIEKHIPVGGGLGGGSADAGAVLRALDALSPNPLGRRLVELATPLGADVPFMTIESPMALAWGRGERLFPLKPLDWRPVILFVPSFGVGTADAYGWLSSDRGSYVPTASVLNPDALATWESLSAIAVNDFEAPVGARHGEIPRIVDRLRSVNALIAMMSGSGSTVFGVFGRETTAIGDVGLDNVASVVTRTSERVRAVEISD